MEHQVGLSISILVTVGMVAVLGFVGRREMQGQERRMSVVAESQEVGALV